MRKWPTAVLCTSGLAAEAKIARAAGFSVVVGAGDRERTASLVEHAVAHANCLVSFGIAGALAPQLRSGNVVVSAEVIAADCRWRGEEGFCRRVAELARKLGAVEGPVLGARAILPSEAEKRRAWQETGAFAVDLESDVVARIAARAGVPFVVVRAIADAAYRELPPAALIPLSEEGRPRLKHVFASVLRYPRQITPLIGLACETKKALAALAEPARALHGLVAGP
jgi:adenosylhomocysteine nucleosidase